MTIEQAKAELCRFKYENQYYIKKSIEIKKMQEQIEILKNNLLPNMEKDGVYKELIERFSEETRNLFKVLTFKLGVENKIGRLEQPLKNVLYFRYVVGMEFHQIAKETCYSSDRIYQLHREAIREYCKLDCANQPQ